MYYINYFGIQVGFVIGATTMMIILNLQTSVYWGQMSTCRVMNDWYEERFSGSYSCDDRAAYGAVSAFAVLLMLVQMGFVAGVVVWRNELIEEEEDNYAPPAAADRNRAELDQSKSGLLSSVVV